MFSSSKALFRKAGGGAGPTTDATFAYVPLLLETGPSSSLNTTVTDSSASPNTVTRTNNPSTGWVSPYQTDGYWGNQFNGTNAYLTTASNAAFGVNSSDFTIEFWVNLNSTSGSQVFFDLRATQPSQAPCVYIAGNARFNYLWNSASPVAFGPATLSTNTWYHVAIVRASGVHTGYVNGVSYSLSTTDSAGVSSSAISICGRQAVSPADYLNGYLSNFRMVKGVAVYTTGFTPSTTPLTATQSANVNGNPSAAITGTQTSLLTCQSNRFKDNGTANGGLPFTVTPNGTPQVDPYFYPSGFTAPAASPGAGLFAAASSQTLITTQTQVIPTGNFTIEVWAYVTSSTATQVFVSQGTSGSAGRTAIGIDNSSGAKWFCQVGGVFVYSSAAPTLNTWNYLAMTYNGATIALYLNGTLLNSASNTTSAQNSQLRVGGLWTPATAGYYLDGYLANIRVSNTVRTVTSVPTTFLTSDANTTLLLNLADSNYTSATNGVQNNTFIDSSNYAFPITRNGTPTQGSITPYWPDGQWSNYFSSASDGLTFSASAGFVLTGGAFTIEFWAYPTVGSNYDTIIDGGMLSGFGLTRRAGTNAIVWQAGGAQLEVGTTFLLNQWSHIVANYTGTGSVNLYINGASVSSAASIPTNTGTIALYVGKYSAGQPFAGYISNVRIVKGSAVYTNGSTITVPTAPLTPVTNTQLLTCYSNRFIDANTATTAKTLTVTGTPRVQAFQPFSPTASYTTALYGGSSLLPTSADYLTIAANATFTLGTANHTVEFWAYQTAYQQYATPWSYASTTANQNTDSYYITNGSLSSALLVGAGGSWGVNLSFTLQTLNTWHHYAITRSGSSWALFIDGTRVGTATYAGSIGAQTQPMAIGRGNFSPNDTFQGYISNLRIVKGTAVYDPAQTTITVPTSPLTAITNTVLLVNGTNAGIYDAAAQNDVTTAGSAVTAVTPAKWSPSSMSFNGSNSYAQVLSNPAFTLGASNFTIEFWVYFNSVASGQSVAGRHVLTAAGDWAIYTASTGSLNYYLSSTGATWNLANQISIGSISTGTWYYVALVRNGSVFTPYIGTTPGSTPTAGTTTTTSSALFATTQALTIGAANNSAGYFNGYVQDFRFTVGVARSITTVPSASFPTR